MLYNTNCIYIYKVYCNYTNTYIQHHIYTQFFTLVTHCALKPTSFRPPIPTPSPHFSQTVPRIYELLDNSNCPNSVSEIVRMERAILVRLAWNTTSSTPLDFLCIVSTLSYGHLVIVHCHFIIAPLLYISSSLSSSLVLVLLLLLYIYK